MLSDEVHMQIERERRNIFKKFSNFTSLKTLRVEKLSPCLRVDDERQSMELLPELREPAYFQAGSGNARAVFISFINARKNIDRPRNGRNPYLSVAQLTALGKLSSETPMITGLLQTPFPVYIYQIPSPPPPGPFVEDLRTR